MKESGVIEDTVARASTMSANNEQQSTSRLSCCAMGMRMVADKRAHTTSVSLNLCRPS